TRSGVRPDQGSGARSPFGTPKGDRCRTHQRCQSGRSERRTDSRMHENPGRARPNPNRVRAPQMTMSRNAKSPKASAPAQTVLVLQGGGALGAYQGGVFEALTDHGYVPDWVVGTSIGAINAALIAGNPPQRRLDRLHEFWQLVGVDRADRCPD